MKYLKIALLIIMLPLMSMSTAHKFYVSITKVEYIEEEKSLQIITKIFTEDLEKTLRERYSSDVHLDSKKETDTDAVFIQKYLLKKLKINVNNTPVTIEYIGLEYENDIIKIYMEIKNVSEIKTFEIENKLLMDMFNEQQNIIHFKKNKLRKSLVLDIDNPKGVLNLD
ncbi:MAG: hypothetical protein ACJAVA_001842 [Flavobacteriaceae bacterium]|jgi:hypothetical protein